MPSTDKQITFYVNNEGNEKLIIDAETYEQILFALEGKRASMDEDFLYGGSDDIFDRRNDDVDDDDEEGDHEGEEEEEHEVDGDDIVDYVNSCIQVSTVIDSSIYEADSHEESEGMSLLEKLLYGLALMDGGPGFPDDEDYDDYFTIYQCNESEVAELQRIIQAAKDKVTKIIEGDEE